MADTDLFDVEAFKRRLALRLQRILAEGGQRLQKLANEQPKAPTQLRTVPRPVDELRVAGRMNGTDWRLVSDAEGTRLTLQIDDGDGGYDVTIALGDAEGAAIMSAVSHALLKKQGVLT